MNRYYRSNLSAIVSTLILLLGTGAISAQIVVDGTADANYGPALSIQNTDTRFGNTDDPDPRTAGASPNSLQGGSELDQVFGVVDNGFLHLMFAGNLEDNFNDLEIFIDSVAGVGMNTIDGLNLPASEINALCCRGFGGDGTALQRMHGLTFDIGFAADYYVGISNGTVGTGDPLAEPAVSGWVAGAHYTEMNNGPAGVNINVGGVLNPFGDEVDAAGISRGLLLGTIIDQNNNLFAQADPLNDIPLHELFEPLDPTNDLFNLRRHGDMSNTIGMLMAVNNSNIAGVNRSLGVEFANTGDPENVTTGIEIALPLAAIGNPTSDIKVTAFINGARHDFTSNQFSGTGVLQDNLRPFPGSSLADFNLSTVAGDQFVTIAIPEPASLVLLGLGGLTFLHRSTTYGASELVTPL